MNSWLSKNLGLKCVALCFALLLEVYFYSPDNSIEAEVPARVELSGLSRDSVIIEPFVGARGIRVEVVARGPRPLVNQVRSMDLAFSVEVPSRFGNDFTAILDHDDLSLPAGVEILSVKPERIKIRTERELKKQLLVVLNRTGAPAKGHEVVSTRLFPDTVVVRGPETLVEPLRAIETTEVSVEGLSASLQKELAFEPLDPLIQPSVTVVSADIEISEKHIKKNLKGLNVKVVADEGLAATIPRVSASIVLKGPPSLLASMSASSLAMRADTRGLGEGKHLVALSVELPTGVRLLEAKPSNVEVLISGQNTPK